MRRAAARLILGALVPVVVGEAASDPYSDRSLVATWWRGAGVLVVAGVVAWAMGELGAPGAETVESLADGDGAP